MSFLAYDHRPGAYFDSIVLMQLQRALGELPGVEDVGVVMATPANRDLLASSGLWPEDVDASPEDLLIVVQAEDGETAERALAAVDDLLRQRRTDGGAGASFRPRSLDSAVKMKPGADWVLISTPGRYAADVAREALDLGRHLFLYSDNVSVDDEVALKRRAQEEGLLVMGPDCGTAIVNGMGLGFSNRVRPGSIGIVAASGTGLQAISVHVHALGGGISQALGTGGRDLSPEVGGITALQALDLLGRDPETETIVLVSKPPAPEVATRLLSKARTLDKAVVVYFMGQPVSVRQADNLYFAFNLQDAADLALVANGWHASEPEGAPTSEGYVRALFSGGTLAYGLVLGLQGLLAPLYSNVPLRESQRLKDPLQSQGHTVLDLGADEFTQGRLHPMMDNDLRLRRLRLEAADPEVGLILLDVVLGEGAHPDPAGDLAPVIAEVRANHGVEVGVLLVATDEDPQDMAAQGAQLEAAGAHLFYEIAGLVNFAIRRTQVTTSGAEPLPLDLLRRPFAAINVGLETFFESLRGQGADVVQVDWRPPAGGNEKMMDLLARLKG